MMLLRTIVIMGKNVLFTIRNIRRVCVLISHYTGSSEIIVSFSNIELSEKGCDLTALLRVSLSFTNAS